MHRSAGLVLARGIGENHRMSPVAHVAIHASQFPENVRRDLLESLRSRRVNHKFHYDSVKQTQKWLALHQAYSPSRNDVNCVAVYEHSFRAASTRQAAPCVHVIGLGCGGGQKDARLLRQFRDQGKEVFYTPCDVSTAMVLTARQTALDALPEEKCFPFVCDLAAAGDLSAAFERHGPPEAARLITFFGMIPNFEPAQIMPRLAGLVRLGDILLFSANLAPGSDYAAGLQRMLPQYDNPPTRDWLLTFLLDLGVERGDGELRFVVEDDAAGGGLKRIAAYFHFKRARSLEIGEEKVEFRWGEAIRLFFSYRYTPDRIPALLQKHGLRVRDQWITDSAEEGVFLAQKA